MIWIGRIFLRFGSLLSPSHPTTHLDRDDVDKSFIEAGGLKARWGIMENFSNFKYFCAI
jgi:hypothetical protein